MLTSEEREKIDTTLELIAKKCPENLVNSIVGVGKELPMDKSRIILDLDTIATVLDMYTSEPL